MILGRYYDLDEGVIQTQRSPIWILVHTRPKHSGTSPDQEAGDPPQGDTTTVLERAPQSLAPPPMYQVLILNDDYTPMEFVVFVIQEFFNKDHETAVQIMLKIHTEGRGVCGVFSRDVAATKVEKVMRAAKEAGHPLQCVSEPVVL